MAGGKSDRLFILTIVAALCAAAPCLRVQAGIMKADWVDTPDTKAAERHPVAAPKSLDLHPEFTFEPIDFNSLPENMRLAVRHLDWVRPIITFGTLPPLTKTGEPLPSPGISGVDDGFGKNLASVVAAVAPENKADGTFASILPPEVLAAVIPMIPLSFSQLDGDRSPGNLQNVTLDSDAAASRFGNDAPAQFSAAASLPDSFPYLAFAKIELKPADEDGSTSDSVGSVGSTVAVETPAAPETSDEAAKMPMGLVSYRALNDIENRIMRRIIGPRKPAVLNPAKGPSMPGNIMALDGREAVLPRSVSASGFATSHWMSHFSDGTVDTITGPRKLMGSDPAVRVPMDISGPALPAPLPDGRGDQFNSIWRPVGSPVWGPVTDDADPAAADDKDVASAVFQDVSDPTTDLTLAVAADTGVLNFYGGAGGGGGGFSAAASFIPPAPVLSFYPSRWGSNGPDWLPPAMGVIRPSGTIATGLPIAADPSSPIVTVTRRSSALPMAITPSQSVSIINQAAPVGSVLPAGIHGYNIADLHPIASTWDSSISVTLSGGRMGGSVLNTGTNVTHAAIWNVSSTGFVDMHPTSPSFIFPTTIITGIYGQTSVGVGSLSTVDHALYWANSSPDSAIDLSSGLRTSTYAQAVYGNQVVGYSYPTDSAHATLWNLDTSTGTINVTPVDLNPSTFIYSYAYGTDGVHQVGSGLSAAFVFHALTWSGSAASASDIHPTSGDFSDSNAVTVLGNRAGGYGSSTATSFQHAILWTALNGPSATDITPALFDTAQVKSINAFAEVGVGTLHNDISGNTHALIWNADGSGYTDLNNYLPAKYTSAEADAIDAAGNVSGWAFDSTTGQQHAMKWLVAVPEPSSLGAVVGVVALFIRRPRRGGRTTRAC